MEKIESVEDQDKLLIQNSIRYLNSLTKMEELNVPTLKSLYRTKCRLMELRRHIYLPKERPNYRCQRCFMNFSEGPTKYEVKPMKLSEFAKKVLSKVKNNKLLTTYQRKYYKKLQKRFPNGFESQNKMVITCNFCKKDLDIWMIKPKKAPISSKKVVTPGKKKKASKKDKFCGLNENVVSQLALKKKNHNQNQDNKLIQATTKSNLPNNGYTMINNNVLNASVSMTNTRTFETADFIPLAAETRKENKIKLSKKRINNDNKSQQNTISNSKLRMQQKSLGNLSMMLKKTRQIQIKSSKMKLKEFLTNCIENLLN